MRKRAHKKAAGPRSTTPGRLRSLLAVCLVLAAPACHKPETELSAQVQSSQTTSEKPASVSAPGHIRLRVLPAIAEGNDALPRIVPNDSVSSRVAAILNVRFDRIDAETRKTRRECRTAEAKMHPDTGPGDFETTVAVTMRGPRYLSLSITGSSDCGGAHPDGYTTGLVLDTITAQPINWLRLLPGSKAGYKSRSADGSDLLYWPPFLKAARAKASEDCADTFKDDVQFTAWLDAQHGTLVGSPAGLSHIASAICGDPVEINIPTARTLGVSPDLLAALLAAHVAAQAEPRPRPPARSTPE